MTEGFDWARLRLWAPAALLALALLAFAAPTPTGLSEPAKRVAVLAVLMALWWILELAPLAVTALLPLLILPLAGVSDLDAVAQAYAHPLIFLFMGGFLLAAAMERWGLHRRLALLALSLAGGRPQALVFAVMAATAFLSLWVSNTATAMVMAPIAASLAAQKEATEFKAALMLGVAFAATIGGMGSLIGTPPNALLAGYLRQAHGIEIGFAEWMRIGLPIVLVLLPVAWLVLTRVSFDLGGASVARLTRPAERLPRISREEVLVAGAMGFAAIAWILRPWIAATLQTTAITDAGVAMAAATALFLIPARGEAGARLLEWRDAQRIRWDVLILFGGGVALANAIGASGLAAALADALSAAQGALPAALLVLVMMVGIVYLGELASNTAMAAIFIPIAGAVAAGLGGDPLTLALPVALAASLGFMLPVATPPNAIVFGTGAVTAGQMLRAGAILDVVSIVLVYAMATVLGPVLF